MVVHNGKERKIRFHDYHEIYKIPGLYEHLFYHTLKCASHDAVSSLLVQEVDKTALSPSDLSVLELGAGNGLVGEALARRGVESIVGVDIIEEAAEAAHRDRPNLYERYYVEDFCDLDRDLRRELTAAGFNCMVCVAALGFGDIPPSAFAQAYNLVADDGWVAFNIKQDFVQENDSTGFARLIKEIVHDGTFDLNVARSYRHRLSVGGEPLIYVAMVGRKQSDISEDSAAVSEDRAEARP
jgi:SAM-dependent methyltransferase